MKAVIIALSVITILLMACAQPPSAQPTEPAPSEPAAPTAPVAPAPPPPAPVPTAPDLEPEPEPQEMSRVARELKEKAAKVKSYSFSYAELPENKVSGHYYVKGTLVRVELLKQHVHEGEQYDTIYLDRVEGRAVAYCELNPVICKKEGVIFRPDFADYEIVYPHEFMAGITAGEDLGSLTHEDAIVQRIGFERDGNYYRVTAHKFYGILMVIEVFDNPEFTGEETGHAYREMVFNLVTEEQVTPPNGW